MNSDLLIEFYSEEMPASILEKTANAINFLIENELSKEKFVFDKAKYFYTPTRLTFIFYSLELDKNLVGKTIRGPSVNANEKAVLGFANSFNVKVNNLIKMSTPKGEYYFFKKSLKETNSISVLEKLLGESFKRISWKKSMRWGNNDLKWIRPLKNILCIYKSKKLNIKFGHLQSNNITLINNYKIEKKLKIKNIKHYLKSLEINSIEIDQNTRRSMILSESKKIAKKLNINFKLNEKLLSEVVCLVQKPYLFQAKFKEKFLKLPQEILITTMIKNQKYFPLYKKKEVLTNNFIVVSNIYSKDKGKKIVEGNERVVNARLEDAAFFWKKDLASKLKENEKLLDRLIFHSELGTLSDKVERLKDLVELLFLKLKLTDRQRKDLLEAIKICKNDLVSQIVREFPNLQGIMGYYYSSNEGYNKEVSLAVRDHYKPQGPDEEIPNSKIGQLISLIDKVDTLVGFFLIDKEPSSSKDPYALRRTALGVIRIIIEAGFDLNLNKIFYQIIKKYRKQSNKKESTNFISDEKTINNLTRFLIDRYENLIKEHKQIDLVIFRSLKIDYTNLEIKKVHDDAIFLTRFIKTDKGKKIINCIKRVFNILDNEELAIKDSEEVNKSLFKTKDELSLFHSYLKISKIKINSNEDFFSSMECLIHPIENFFNNVQINVKDTNLRKNRLILLTKLKNQVNQISDFSVLIKG